MTSQQRLLNRFSKVFLERLDEEYYKSRYRKYIKQEWLGHDKAWTNLLYRVLADVANRQGCCSVQLKHYGATVAAEEDASVRLRREYLTLRRNVLHERGIREESN